MREEKQLLKDEIREKMDRHGSFLIMHYAGLAANAANAFRREIGKMGGDIEVVRKRVFIKVAEEAGLSLNDDLLEGHLGLVFLGPDPIETTKTVFRFSRERDGVIKVRGGRFEGQVYGGEDVEKLSKLPDINEMRAQLLSVFEAPMAETLAVMEALLSSVVYCIDNKTKQDQTGQEA